MKHARHQLALQLDQARHELALRTVEAEPSRVQLVRERTDELMRGIRHLAEAVATDEPALFHAYRQWAHTLWTTRGLSANLLRHDIDRLRAVLGEWLSPDLLPLLEPCLDAAELSHTAEAESAGASSTSGQATLTGLADRYLATLLRGRPGEAAELIHQARNAGATLMAINREVFQPTQEEVGRRWQANRLSVAQEHFCTAATQRLMTELNRQPADVESTGRVFVGACVSRELHDLAIRMVTDGFTIAGWRAVNLGANVDDETLLDAIHEHQPDVVGLSVTMTYHLKQVDAMIRSLRATSIGHGLTILVGGQPFNLAHGLWRKFDANGYAPDAPQAVTLAERLTESLAEAG